MTLATRCTACGTIFRVVQDQLRVSNGWVRCGRCGEAFNAVDAMVELPPPRAAMPVDETPRPESSPPADPAASPEPTAPPPAEAGPAAEVDASTAAGPAQDPAPAPPPDVELQQPEVTAGAITTPMIDLPPGVELIASDGAVGDLADVPRPTSDANDVRPEPATPDALDLPAPLPAETAAAEAASGLGPAIAAGADAIDTTRAAEAPPADAAAATAPEPAIDPDERAPSFVVAADRAARWRRPGVRLMLALGVLVALLGLAGQASYVFRDRLAAQAPPLRPWLQRACAALDCRVGDVRQIDALSVESSGLVRVEGSTVYRLSVTLRNRAAFDVAAPAIDLSLTDAAGQLFSRRVLTMADLELPLRTLKAGSELPIQVPLGIKDRAVSGYTVEIFYP